MSRTVGGDFLLGPIEKEELYKRMWHIADFMCIEILDYVIMSNHYHQLVQTPAFVELTDAELLRKVIRYYGVGSKEAVILETALMKGGEVANSLREYYFNRMGDISQYQKILKQTFSRWYNNLRDRRGTLWMERFKSLVVEDNVTVLQSVSAYIDLNPVRASLVEDPKDFHYCAYAAALAGDHSCRQGLMRIMGIDDWETAANQYRVLLMQRGSKHVAGKSGKVSRELYLKTLKAGGKLPLTELILLKIRYFTEGGVLGTEVFVDNFFTQNRSQFGKRRTTGAQPFKGLASGSLYVLRNLRQEVFS
jgi:hypothetical protein